MAGQMDLFAFHEDCEYVIFGSAPPLNQNRETVMKMKKFILTFLLSMLVISVASHAAEWEVKNVSEYKGVYKDKRRIILEAIDRLPANTPISERMRIYDSEMLKLKQQFRGERKSEYESKQAAIATAHSCTSGSSGGVKNCGWKCSTSPNTALLFTQSSWVKYEGTVKGRRITSTEACIKETVAGSGSNQGTVTAIFRYLPATIETLLNAEVEQLSNMITDQV
jgi:hypothetical protein